MMPSLTRPLACVLLLLLAPASAWLPEEVGLGDAPETEPTFEGSITADSNGADLTLGYDPVRPRQMGDTLVVEGDQEQIDQAERLAQAQLGWLTGTLTARPGRFSMDPLVANGSVAQLSALVLTVGEGWFLSLDREPAQTRTLLGPADWALRAGESFTAKLTGTGCGLPAEGITLDLVGAPQGGDYAAGLYANPRIFESPTGTDRFRSDELRAFVEAPVLPGCAYSVTYTLALRFVFESNVPQPGVGWVPQPEDYKPDAQFATAQLSLGDGDHAAVPVLDAPALQQPMTVLYAPVLPLGWVCGALEEPADCIQAAMQASQDDGSPRSAIYPDSGESGVYVLLVEFEGGAPRAALHLVPDANDFTLTASRIVTLDASGDPQYGLWA